MEPNAQAALYTTIGVIVSALITTGGLVYTNKRISDLEKKLSSAFNYIKYLLKGIDKLTLQIVNEHKAEPCWEPDWIPEDLKEELRDE